MSGPNTLVGLAKPSGDAPLNKSAAIKALVPSYVNLLKELKALGVPEVHMWGFLSGDLCAKYILVVLELLRCGVVVL